MTEHKICQDCHQRHDCQKIYEQLGNFTGPSVVFKVIVAFLLPVIVFIVSLAVFEEIFAKAVNTEQLQTLLGFLIALLITFVCILIVRAISRRLR